MSIEIPNVPKYVVPQDLQPHCRIAIRRWIKQLMIVNTDVNDWFTTRVDSMFLEEDPAGFVYFDDEVEDHQNTSPRTYLSESLFVIQVARRGDSVRPEFMQDWLDSRAWEIERAMLTDRFLGMDDFIEDTVWIKTDTAKIVVEGADTHYQSIGLFFNIKWRSDFFGDANKLDEFLTFINTIETTDGAVVVDDVTIRTE